MKKFMFMLILIIPFMVHAEPNYLYDVMKNSEGVNTSEFTREHKDSFSREATDKIYTWKSQAIEEANSNVIFANHCWEIMRTTDTGGVKLIYNGEPENGQCLATRGNHVGYWTLTTESLSSNYWYGTDFEYNKETGSFKLAGDTVQETWSNSTYEDLIGKYTCKSNSLSTCTRLYYVVSYSSSTSGNVFPVTSGAYTEGIGYLQFNPTKTSLAYFGYMYNTVYTNITRSMYSSHTILSSSNLNTSYWYGDDISYDSNSGTYTLVNPFQINSTTEYASISGKYTLFGTSASGTNSYAYYISGADTSKIYYFSISSGKYLADVNYPITYGSSFTDNGDGTYTIGSPTTINRSDWFSSYRDVSGKYICRDTTSNTCSDLVYASSTTNVRYNYIKPIKFSNTFEYDEATGKYTLSTNIKTIMNYSSTDMNSRHYTCLSESIECETLYYVYKSLTSQLQYIELKNGNGVVSAVNQMMYNDDVNKKNSTVKSAVDAWYEHNMLDYTDYLEETIYCNSRVQKNKTSNGWWPNAGYNDMNFNDAYSGLTCSAVTDQFSIDNDKAKLTYPIGIPSFYEAYLSRSVKSKLYMISTPGTVQFSGTHMYHLYGTSLMAINWTSISDSSVIRPVISLKKGATYLSGDGSPENPYTVDTRREYSIYVEVKNETKDMTISVEDITRVLEGESVDLSITPIRGYKLTGIEIVDSNDNPVSFEVDDNNHYSFIMPKSNVTIKPSYKKVASIVGVEDNPHTKEVEINVNDTTAVIYEDRVVFSIQPEDGYAVLGVVITDIDGNEIDYEETGNENEYTFIMPDVDVIIKPSYLKLDVPQDDPKESAPQKQVNPNTGTKNVLFVTALFGVGTILFLTTKKKKIFRI